MTSPEDSRGASQDDEAAGRLVSMVRTVTFDVHGTLIHAPRLAAIYTEELPRHGVPVREETVARTIPLVWREMACRADPRHDRFATAEDGGRGFWARFVERVAALATDEPTTATPDPFAAVRLYDRFAHAGAWEVHPDVAPVLGRLRAAGLRLGVVSNADARLPGLLDELGLARSFDAVVTSGAAGIEKPNPRLFTIALDRLGTPPRRALHVGDHPIEDVEGARAAGMHARLLHRAGPHALADLIATTAAELGLPGFEPSAQETHDAPT